MVLFLHATLASLMHLANSLAWSRKVSHSWIRQGSAEISSLAPSSLIKECDTFQDHAGLSAKRFEPWCMLNVEMGLQSVEIN
jgi:hypothetical protein